MSEPLDAAAVRDIGDELRKLADLGVIGYYLPTIPEGEQFVVGLKGQILKMNQDSIVFFLAGVTAASEFMARRAGMHL
jgi:hypothetical protein